MKPVKNSIIIGSILLCSIHSNAQEFSITLNGGFQGLDYKIKEGDNKIQFGGKAGLGYTYFFNKNWGIVTGAEFGFYKNSSTLKDKIYTTNQVDSDTDGFEYRNKTVNYKEITKFNTINIPLMVQYHTNGKAQFFINGGGRVFFPFAYKINSTADQLDMTGYYADLNIELDQMPRHGFSNLTNWTNNNKNSLKTAFALSAETGVSFKITDAVRLYTGLYIDYGLNDIQKKNNTILENPIVNYDSEGTMNIKPNGMLKADGFVDNAKLLAYGFQIKIGFSKKQVKKETDIIVEDKIEEIVIVEKTPEVIKEPETIISEKEIEFDTIKVEEIKIIEDHILFKTLGNTKLSEENKKQLNEITEVLKLYPNQKVEIQGYSCSIGTEDRNIRVRLKRAQAVGEYLETKGILPEQYEIKPVIEVEPLFPNNSESNRQKNRRAVIKLIK